MVKTTPSSSTEKKAEAQDKNEPQDEASAAPQEKKKKRTQSVKAGLNFPVSKVVKQLKNQKPKRFNMSGNCCVACASYLQLVSDELLRLAVNQARQQAQTQAGEGAVQSFTCAPHHLREAAKQLGVETYIAEASFI